MKKDPLYYKIMVADWVHPSLLPYGEQQELFVWTTAPVKRVCSCVRIEDRVFILTRAPGRDKVIETWEVMIDPKELL